MTPARCEACDAPLRAGLAPWHRRCPSCGLESSTLTPAIGEGGAAARIDEDARETALQPIRDHNFDLLLRWLLGVLPAAAGAAPPRRLLDVGCAHGWFAAKAAAAGFDVLGIEPDAAIAARAEARGVRVRAGYFPDALEAGESFDAIVFNDVLEHVPGVVDAMRACRDRLGDGGLLVVNAPDRRGPFYRMAALLWRAGVRGPFERMWQKDMPSPHLYYFDDASMAQAAAAAGLRVRATRRLPALALRGLYARIRFDRSLSAPAALLLYAGSLALLPVLRLLPSDISVWFLEPGRSNSHTPSTVDRQATG
jgi:SAM-dependent methyltransferase